MARCFLAFGVLMRPTHCRLYAICQQQQEISLSPKICRSLLSIPAPGFCNFHAWSLVILCLVWMINHEYNLDPWNPDDDHFWLGLHIFDQLLETYYQLTFYKVCVMIIWCIFNWWICVVFWRICLVRESSQMSIPAEFPLTPPSPAANKHCQRPTDSKLWSWSKQRSLILKAFMPKAKKPPPVMMSGNNVVSKSSHNCQQKNKT